ncbi:MFS transporter [Nocardia nova]|uniref:MFS transporter n=1 Tax=Nocardia nova TaxID=37330 RepID=UPI0006875266|nr:MFS transporter [Nocardia nova]
MTVETTEPTTDSVPANRRSRVVIASLIGTSIEFYDFYIYGTAAVLVFPKLFFPHESPTAAQLSSFVTFALAFFARPIGSVVFGHFGDRIGRKRTLVSSLLIMGTATVLIGCLPTYAVAGLWAPVLLAVLRFVQGVGLGGEWSGATLLATENAPEGRRGLFGSLPQLGAPIGFFLANGVFLLLTAIMPAHSDDPGAITFDNVGWRIPFLLSAILVVVGLYVRLQIVESRVFTDVAAADNIARVPATRLVRTHWRHLVLGTLLCVSTYVLFYLMTTFTLTYGTAAAHPASDAKAGLGFSRTEFLTILLVGVVFFAVFTTVAGLLTDRVGRRRTLLVTLVAVAVFGVLFQPWFTTAGSVPLSVSFVIVGLALMGLSYGPMGSLLPELFPADVRYTGSAVVYNLAGVLGASLAPIIAVALWRPDGNIAKVGLYLSAAGVLSLLALLGVRETRDIDYTAQTPPSERPPAPVG